MSGLRVDQNVGEWIVERARRHPDRVAVRVDETGERATYAELGALSGRCLARLAELGLQSGDRLALALRSEPLYLALYFAAARLGAILVPLNTRLSRDELAYQLEDARPKLVIHAAELELQGLAPGVGLARDAFVRDLPEPSAPPYPAAAEPAAVETGGERPQVLLYTSGTTGVAQGVLLPHRKTVFNTANAERFLELAPGQVLLAPVPLFHSFGLKILAVPALHAGAELVLVNRFDAERVQRSVRRHAATLLAGVPVMFQRMLRAGLRAESLASLRLAFSAGAALDPACVEAFAEIGVPLVQGYGQTETSILCAVPRAEALRKAGSVGRPVANGELRIVDRGGHPVAPGSEGEIQVRGGICLLGYWRRDGPPVTLPPDGWHATGDLGVIDEDGFVTLRGRAKDMYVSGGENVYPAEVERVLEQHPDVAEAAVVGVPDPEWGEVGRAYLVCPERRVDLEELRVFARDRLAGYKRPRQLVLLDALPRTASGKVRKQLLRERDAG